MPELFQNLSERLSGVFDRLTKQGALSEADVQTALRKPARQEVKVQLDQGLTSVEGDDGRRRDAPLVPQRWPGAVY